MPFGSGGGPRGGTGGGRAVLSEGLRSAGVTASPDIGPLPAAPWAPFPARPHSGMAPLLAAWQRVRTAADGPEAAHGLGFRAAAGEGSTLDRSEADPAAAPRQQQPAAAAQGSVAGAGAVPDADYRITVWTSDVRGAGTSAGPLITLQVGACDWRHLGQDSHRKFGRACVDTGCVSGASS